jgi:hypothetical protein
VVSTWGTAGVALGLGEAAATVAVGEGVPVGASDVGEGASVLVGSDGVDVAGLAVAGGVPVTVLVGEAVGEGERLGLGVTEGEGDGSVGLGVLDGPGAGVVGVGMVWFRRLACAVGPAPGPPASNRIRSTPNSAKIKTRPSASRLFTVLPPPRDTRSRRSDPCADRSRP